MADYVQRVRAEKRLSLNDVRIRSGYQIVNSYISRIENGDVTNVGLEKLSALAKGLGVPGDEIFAVARGVPQKSESGFAESDFARLYFKHSKVSEKDPAEGV